MAPHDRGPCGDRSPDLVNRDFTADRPDALWVADFTYVRCYEGMVFFSFVIDSTRGGSSVGSSPRKYTTFAFSRSSTTTTS